MTTRMNIDAFGISNGLRIPAYCIPRDDESAADAAIRSIMAANGAKRHIARESGRAADRSYWDHDVTFIGASGSVIGRCTIRSR